MPKTIEYVAVLDIGKTNVKLHVLNADLNSVGVESIPNTVLLEDPYPQYSVDKIWDWLVRMLREFAANFSIGAINVSAHGATAAIVNANVSNGRDGLVLPILDYEFDGPDRLRSDYDQVRPGFESTYSPVLPFGLNLGAQLFWQSRMYPEAFAQASHILAYPQYWVWRMTGALCSEVTSLGCHTDLWCPGEGQWSSLATKFGWSDLFPSLVSAWGAVANVHPRFAEQTGLDPSCRIFPGLHDSNASFARYLGRAEAAPFAVVSTGTWAIAMASGASLQTLDSRRDMLANVDAMGRPIACARSMGGREYDKICETLGATTEAYVDAAEISEIVNKGAMALPDFSGGSGPFGGAEGAIVNAYEGMNGTALATLYAALMVDLKLNLLEAQGDVFIEGAFANNQTLCALVAQLRPDQRVFVSGDKTGTVVGCAQLAFGTSVDPVDRSIKVSAAGVSGLRQYKDLWRKNLPSVLALSGKAQG
ncbi:MAG: FGGY family carbohydrate kinase [Pseudomonadota bacterium]